MDHRILKNLDFRLDFQSYFFFLESKPAFSAAANYDGLGFGVNALAGSSGLPLNLASIS